MVYNNFEAEANEVELYVRFAYQLIATDYAQRPGAYDTPSVAIRVLRDRFAPADDWRLDLMLCAFQYLVGRGVSTRFARTAMIERARQGCDFRSVVFVDYKATRRDYPRVTNRGVVSGSSRKPRP